MKRKYRYTDQAKRILAREEGTVFKDWGGRLPIALIYPNTYRLGMSSLAVHTLYRLFNDRPDVVCERAFWGYQSPPEDDEPIISLESQRPLADFPLLAFSLSYEMDYFNTVQALRRAGIPLLADDRDESWPLILAGGPAVYANPAPLADILDAIFIGEAEDLLPQLVDALQEACRASRPQALRILAQVPGVYVPAIGNDPVSRVWKRDLDAQPATTQIYAPDTEFGDRALIEIGRGCVRGCRFCMAGYVYRPMREMSLDAVLATARDALQYRDKLGLVSAAVSDHRQIDQIAVELRALGARIAISSMRVDPLSEPLLQALADSGTRTLTIAPETGSDRLRRCINKRQTDEQLLHAVDLAAHHGFQQIKMYFMVGHPTETDADIEDTVNLVLTARARFPGRLIINTTPYVPKPHTPFQWAAMTPVKILEARIKYLKRRLQPERVTVRSDSPAWATVAGTLSRGDRQLGRVLAQMKGTGLREWRRALKVEGLSQEDYLRGRSMDEPLPWSVVDMGVSRRYLTTEMQTAILAESDCSPQTQDCP